MVFSKTYRRFVKNNGMTLEIRKLFDDFWEFKTHNSKGISFREETASSEEEIKKKVIPYVLKNIEEGIEFKFIINK